MSGIDEYEYTAQEIDQTLIDDLLISNDRWDNMKGRLFATGVTDTFRDYIDHERERGTPVGAVLMTISEVSALVLGSMISQYARSPDARNKLVDAISKELDRHLRQLVILGWRKRHPGS